MKLPEHTVDYLKVRRVALDRFLVQTGPVFKLYRRGIMSHASYRQLIQPFWWQYSIAIDVEWIKAGGDKIKIPKEWKWVAK